MRARIVQPLIALLTLVALLPVFWVALTLSLGQHKREERVKVEGKEELQLITTSVDYFREDDFWRPVYVMIGIVALMGIMYYVSASQRKWIPALIGVVTAIGFCLFGQKLWPKGDLTVFLHGMGTITMAFIAFGLVWGALYFSQWFANRQTT